MFPSIVADIGGTNARFALVTGVKDNQFCLEQIHILNGRDYASFEDAMKAYLELVDVKVKSCCVAIAGPISGDQVQMTNLSWSFSQQAIREAFGFEKFAAINDFASLAVATSALLPEHLENLRAGERDQQGNKAILGPGTGLGVAGLAHNPGAGWLPIPSEGGHANISPATPLECEVIQAAMAVHGHVSAEVFISGPGLVNLYQALCMVNDIEPRKLEPKDVTGEAMAGSDEMCKNALEMFCSFLGTVSGNLALTYGAKGGVYIGGGVIPRIKEFILNSTFSERFAAKGIMSGYVKDIPVDLIVHPQTAFLGAATWLSQL